MREGIPGSDNGVVPSLEIRRSQLSVTDLAKWLGVSVGESEEIELVKPAREWSEKAGVLPF